MERRHDPATFAGTPGLLVAPFSAVAAYPAAAVLTAWANALHRTGEVVAPPPHLISLDEPVSPSAADVDFWPQARMSLGETLTAVPGSWWPARCALPVPGDMGGLPAGATRALSAGQAVVWSHAGQSVVLSPITMPGGDRMWQAERSPGATVGLATTREANRTIMAALERCVTVAESSLLPRQLMASAAVSQVADHPVPLPPTTDAATVALARQSAILLTIVATAMTALPETTEAAEVREALIPLGRAARAGLSVAFSAAGER